jgi:short-subunit dehydrogenase
MNMSTANTAKGTALVTGASSGLGSVYADRLAKRGFNLTLVARREDRLLALADKLRSQYGISVRTLAADLGTPAGLKTAGDEILQDASLAMVVNNAGTATLSAIGDVSLENHDAMINVNTTALSRLSLAALAVFKQRDAGTIVNIGSVLSFNTLPISGVYSGTKGYVMNFTRGLQQEVQGTNVVVQLVLPATTATEIWEVGGIPLSALNQASVMTIENCVDAALSGLDRGELVTLPSVEDAQLWADFDAARTKLFAATQTGKPASRYQVAG